MRVTRYIRALTEVRDGTRGLTEEDAHDLFAAMLDGGVSDLELGACLMALRIKSASTAELLGFYRATAERLYTLRPPASSLKLRERREDDDMPALKRELSQANARKCRCRAALSIGFSCAFHSRNRENVTTHPAVRASS